MGHRKVHLKSHGNPLCGLIIQNPKLVDVIDYATCKECLKVWTRKNRRRALRESRSLGLGFDSF